MHREFIYFEVKEKDMLSSTEIGMVKIPLRDILETRVENAYEVHMALLNQSSMALIIP